ncbi:serine/threonine-protein kinase gad8-like [Xenopus tropicalis]|uniref:Serine/threonine-protein kinase gad8-like n=1 Tax=Xenopus tropicalis TaxID=8364 RepID=A0A8J1JPG1_XENTR|nr:serine/threonine-protein kinase gad8-like [Xenopus tropicalis]XP_031758501.1 serine/threonine-protein kinase gad8-like [Xenopus tropicalis]
MMIMQRNNSQVTFGPFFHTALYGLVSSFLKLLVLQIIWMAYDSCVDYWSLGVILHEMLTGRIPTFSWFRKTLQCPENLNPEAKDILMNLLTYSPSKRRNFVGNIKQHPFFKPIDWKALEAGKIKPPFIPPPASDLSGPCYEMLPPSEVEDVEHLNHLNGLSFVCKEWRSIPPKQ